MVYKRQLLATLSCAEQSTLTIRFALQMTCDKTQIENNLRLHVDRLAGLIGPRYLQKPKTIDATIGYIEGQWAGIGYENSREHYEVDASLLSSSGRFFGSRRQSPLVETLL